MNSALWLLIRLQLAGWLRYLGRNVRTLKGALLALVGLGVFVPWLLSLVLSPAAAASAWEPATVRRTGPTVLVLYCLMNLMFSSSDKAIYFSPAEVNFLFTGPFSRRQVLGYKITLTLLVGLPSMLLLSFILRVRDAWFPAVFAGLLLTYVFLQLFSMALGLIASSLGARLYTRGRRVALGLVLAVAAFLLIWSGALAGVHSVSALLDRVEGSPVWQVVSFPFMGFTETALAQNWFDLARYFALGAGVDLALVVLVLTLDAHYLESSASASARLYARLQRARGRSVSVDDNGPALPQGWVGSRLNGLSVPMFPYLGGVGPQVWRQLTVALRGMGRLMLVLLILGTIFLAPLLASGLESQEAALPTMIALGSWMTIFFTALVPYDFRGDIDRLGVLKTLPIPAWSIALGELIVPTLILSTLQVLAFACMFLVAPQHGATLLACALLTAPLNFVLFAIENLLFLLFPVRLMASTPGDFQALGRNVLLVFAKVIGLGAVGAAALALAALTYYATDSLWIALALAWAVILSSGLLLVPFIALAFQAFDVGRDTPA